MGTHNKTKSQRKKPRRADPTDWGEWEYWDIYSQEVRSRINEQGEEIYEYRPAQTADVPRTTPSGTDFAEHDDTAGEDIPGYGYRELSPTENMTDSLFRSTLSSVPPTPNEYDGTFQAGSLPAISLPRYNAPFQPSPGLAAGNSVSSNPFQPSSSHQSQSYGSGGVPTYDSGLSTSPAGDRRTFDGSVPGFGRMESQNLSPTVQTGSWGMGQNNATQTPRHYSGANYMTNPTANVASQNPRRTPSMFDPNIPIRPIRGVRNIRTNNSEAGSSKLHKDYKIHHSEHFKIGHIFRVVWSEPMGDTALGYTRESNVSMISDTRFDGVKSYTSVRRFVIVATSIGHSVCIPILTYGGQGTTKPGVKPEYHAVIYTKQQSNKSAEVLNEQPLPNAAICMDPLGPRDVLDMASRINYSKVYTIEHNIKVVFIGKIRDDMRRVFLITFRTIQATIGEVDLDQIIKEDDEGDGNNEDNAGREGKGDKRDRGDKKGKREVHESNRKFRQH